MAYNHNDPLWNKKITLPIQYNDGTWEFFYGGKVPVQNGTLGELTLNIDDINDDRFRQRVTSETNFKILSEKTELMVALSDPSRKHFIPYGKLDLKDFPEGFPPGTTRWETIQLGPMDDKTKQHSLFEDQTGGLWLKIKGLEKCDLKSSTILMPKGSIESVATSLNHAFTLLSKEYETHRISNTGNVYTRVYYKDQDGCWYPLKDLRSGAQAKVERTLLNSLWKEVEEKLGWHPIPSSKNPKK